MSEVLKVLGQANPSAKTLTDAYTVPASTEAKVYAVLVCNRAKTPTTFRISIAPGGASDVDKHYQYYDRTVEGNETLPVTLGHNGVTLAATDKIRVYAYDANLSFSVHGVEVLGGIAGEWKDYTATYDNLTVGSGADIHSRYIENGEGITVRLSIILGTSSSVGDVRVSLPVTASSAYHLTDDAVGIARFIDSDGSNYAGHVRLQTTTRVRLMPQQADGTYLLAAILSSVVPFTWADTDRLNAIWKYEPA